ncbi:MAG: hypothetical protein ACXAEN_19490 [Candidatus Thorarchaeota archaeon]|jgi:hypothetical protein
MAKKKRRRAKRKILPMLIDSAGVLHAGFIGAEAGGGIQAGAAFDGVAAGKSFVGQLTRNYAGFDAITGEMDLMALGIGYGPPIIRRMISKMGVRINWPF